MFIVACRCPKGILGLGGGEASKNNLKDTSFIYSMTNITILGVFRTHAPKEYGNDFCTYILNILALIFSKLGMYLRKVWSKRHPL